MEGMVDLADSAFWKGKRVFITGHTGFKGSWMSLLLHEFGAKVYGYSLSPPTKPSLFKVAGVGSLVRSKEADIRDLKTLQRNLLSVLPEVVIHMAAQSLVRESYATPVDTYSVNVMGTVNILEAVRNCASVKAVVIVTSDKCYENREWLWSYRENEPLGGFDPYSSSKACAELVTASYRKSFFEGSQSDNAVLASVRAGNVIGGGDWAKDRLIPDCIRAISGDGKIIIRNPGAVRPWQHVLEPLTGYLLLAENMVSKGQKYSGAWNFGPDENDTKPVSWIAERVSMALGASVKKQRNTGSARMHEAGMLRLDSSKARALLGWQPIWDIEKAVDLTLSWYQAYMRKEDMRRICVMQIKDYFGVGRHS